MIVVLLMMALFGNMACSSKNDNVGKNWERVIITKPGLYEIKRLKYNISINIDNDKILHYHVKNNLGKKIIESIERPSVFHRWCLYWDQNDKLWVWSSDIGGFVWEKDSHGLYKQYIINSSSLDKEMPLDFYQFLPSSVRRKWEKDDKGT